MALNLVFAQVGEQVGQRAGGAIHPRLALALVASVGAVIRGPVPEILKNANFANNLGCAVVARDRRFGVLAKAAQGHQRAAVAISPGIGLKPCEQLPRWNLDGLGRVRDAQSAIGRGNLCKRGHVVGLALHRVLELLALFDLIRPSTDSGGGIGEIRKLQRGRLMGRLAQAREGIDEAGLFQTRTAAI